MVHSPDTDVLALLLTGREGKLGSVTRYIPIHDLIRLLKPEHHGILLCVYCLSGCDTKSSFIGHEKNSIQNNDEILKAVASIIMFRYK